MDSRQFHLHGGKKGAALAIRLTTRSRRNEISEISSDGTIKVRLMAGPADEQINTALVDFLAQVLGIPKMKIEIVGGMSGRDKLVSILDLDADAVQERIVKHLS